MRGLPPIGGKIRPGHLQGRDQRPVGEGVAADSGFPHIAVDLHWRMGRRRRKGGGETLSELETGRPCASGGGRRPRRHRKGASLSP